MLSNRLIVNYVPHAMDELPIRQSRSQPVNPSHVTINGLAHYCTHNASVDNSIYGHDIAILIHLELGQHREHNSTRLQEALHICATL